MEKISITDKEVMIENYKYLMENEKYFFIQPDTKMSQKTLSECAYYKYMQNKNCNNLEDALFLVLNCFNNDRKYYIEFLNSKLKNKDEFINFDSILKFVSENNAQFFKAYHENIVNEEDEKNIMLLKSMVSYLKKYVNKADIIYLLSKVVKYKNKKEAFKILASIYINRFDEFNVTEEDLNICISFLRSNVQSAQNKIVSLINKNKLYKLELFQCNSIYNIGQTYKNVGQKIYKSLPINKKQNVEDFVLYINCFVYCYEEIIKDFVSVNLYLKNFDIIKNEIKRFFSSLEKHEFEEACKMLDEGKEKLMKYVIDLTICNN